MKKSDVDSRNDNSATVSADLLGRLGKLAVPILFVFLIGDAIDTVFTLVDAAGRSRTTLNTIVFVIFSLFYYRFYRQKTCSASKRQIVFLRYIFVLAFIAYLTTVSYPYIRVYFYDYGPAPQSPVNLSSLWDISSAYAATPAIEVLALHVDTDRSSFEDVKQTDQSTIWTSGQRIRTFQYNQRVDSARKRGDCIGVHGDAPIRRVLPLLSARLKTKKLDHLIPYVESISGYRRLMAAGGEKFLDVLYTQDEISLLREEDNTNWEYVAEWLVECVGVTEPILTLIVRNNTGVSTVIDEVTYIVDHTAVVLGGARGPAVPEYTYKHAIPHDVGEHSRPLTPPFIVEARSVGTIGLALRYDGTGRGRTWLMRIRVSTVDGAHDISERFQLILSK